MRGSWTLAAAGALFLALLGGLVVLPGRLVAPEHRVQVAVGFTQQSGPRSVQAAPPVAMPPVAIPAPAAPRPVSIRLVVPRPRPVPHRSAPAHRLAAVIVTVRRPVA